MCYHKPRHRVCCVCAQCSDPACFETPSHPPDPNPSRTPVPTPSHSLPAPLLSLLHPPAQQPSHYPALQTFPYSAIPFSRYSARKILRFPGPAPFALSPSIVKPRVMMAIGGRLCRRSFAGRRGAEPGVAGVGLDRAGEEGLVHCGVDGRGLKHHGGRFQLLK